MYGSRSMSLFSAISSQALFFSADDVLEPHDRRAAVSDFQYFSIQKILRAGPRWYALSIKSYLWLAKTIYVEVEGRNCSQSDQTGNYSSFHLEI